MNFYHVSALLRQQWKKKTKTRCNLKTHGAEGLMGDTDKEMSNYNA